MWLSSPTQTVSANCFPHQNQNPWSLQTSTPTRLDFEDLSAFEIVKDQYRHQGIRFEHAIALEPSNPAFPLINGSRVLMPVAEQTCITLHFKQPVQHIGAWVTSARTINLTAFDTEGRQVGRVSLGPFSYLALSPQHTAQFPQQILQIKGRAIAKVVFESSAPFTLDNLFFSAACHILSANLA